jgi:hypothetical protein
MTAEDGTSLEVSKMPASFRIRGPFEVPLDPNVNSKWIKDGCQEFWSTSGAEGFADRCGCYVFAMRASKGFRPIYVGKAPKSFKQECFASHKISCHYGPALLNSGKGAPVLFLVVLKHTKGKVNKSAIKKVESFLIQNAMKKNPDLSNIKGKKVEHWSIDGVIRSGKGKVSSPAKLFKRALGF